LDERETFSFGQSESQLHQKRHIYIGSKIRSDIALPEIEDIRAEPAIERVCPSIAAENVIASIAIQEVVSITAVQGFIAVYRINPRSRDCGKISDAIGTRL
jgi:hypothetical protein